MDRNGFWKAALLIGIGLSLTAFVLGWISFGVPDWHAFKRYNGSPTEFYGLWAYCQEQTPILGTNCQRWSTAQTQLFNGSLPNFIRTSEGLITTGMILLSLGLVVAIAALALPLLSYIAALLALLAFIFLVIGLPVFGRQSNSLSASRGDSSYFKRYGFWLMVPTIVLEFLAIIFFLAAGFLYKLWGYGDILTGAAGTAASLFGSRPYGGRQVLGPPNMLGVPAAANRPYGMIPPFPPPMPYAMAPRPFFGGGSMMPPPYSYQDYDDTTEPTLLSQYLARSLVRPANSMMLPPSYGLQFGQPYGPSFTPIVNLTGQTLVGPIQRTF